MKRMLSGIKPTGQLTLGNYIGALRNFVKYQEDYEMLAFIANLHCITSYQEPRELNKNLQDAVALYLACGLDPDKATIFLQTDIQAQAQLGYIMACHTYLGELNRMTQFKDKQQKNETNLTAGLYTYPCLMSADILIYDADYVPIGDDQKQHLELTRDIAQRFNNKYGDTFKVPEGKINKIGARIMSLNNPESKMSKSEGNDYGCIYLLDDLKLVNKKIMRAVTDSYGEIKANKEKQPGLYNLLEIAASLSDTTPEDIANEYQGRGYGDLKKYVSEIVCNKLKNIQDKYDDIIKNNVIPEVLKQGKEKVEIIANQKLKEVEAKLGLKIY